MIPSSTARILILGTDSHFLYLMQRYVRIGAHELLCAHLDDEALALAQREKPSAIVLEVNSPGSGAWHVLRALKVDRATGSIPVVLCSWLDEEARARQEGADVYLRMPILYEDFRAALTTIGIQ